MLSRRDLRLAFALYLLCAGVYAATAAGRLRGPSTDTHFVYMADTWLHRRLDLGRSPPHSNDWAEVEHLTLRDGTQLAGGFQRHSPGRFRLLGGGARSIDETTIVKRDKRYYVSFPPLPAALLLPLVAIFKHRTNDVLFTVLLAGLIPALFFLLLRRLPSLLPPVHSEPVAGPLLVHPELVEGRVVVQQAHHEQARDQDEGQALRRDLWLTGLLAFGTVLYFSAVLGQVWYTAHVVSLVLAALFFHASIGARHPALAGLTLGALMLTRPQMVFLGTFYLFEAARGARADGRYPLWPPLKVDRPWLLLRPLLQAAPTFLVLALVGFAYNYARFRNPFEFGHSYLTTIQADNIHRYGLFNYHYLSRNLAAAFTLLPRLLPRPPYLQISYHGLSLLVTTPVLAYLLWPEVPRGSQAAGLRRVLWLSILPVAAFSFLYQNDGYIQFGFRFSLDYLLPLLLVLAIGSPRAVLTRRFQVLVLVGVVVNLFGAITFGRAWQFYFNEFFPAQ